MKIWKISAILLVSLVIVGCGGGDAPTATPNLTLPTTQPETRSQPEVTAEVTAEITPEVTTEAFRSVGDQFVGLTSDIVFAPRLQTAQTPTGLCEAALPAGEPETREFTQAEQVLEEGVDYRAIFCTDAGPIYVDLYEDETPITVNNFVFLAQNGYYNDTTFHRVIADFMAQGGDPTGTGSGGPGYQFEDEFVGFLFFDVPGLLAMANAGANTNGSQFFITTVPTPHLNFAHTVFGAVLEGQENTEAIQVRDPEQGGPATTLQTVLIITDPTTVETTYVAPEAATDDDVVTAFATFAEDLAGSPFEITNSPEPITTPAITDAVSGEVEAAYGEHVAQQNHAYRFVSRVNNTTCSLQSAAFYELGYTLDAFDSAETAQLVIDDEALPALMEDNGFSSDGDSVYTESVTACDAEAVRIVKFVQRGRFVAMAEGIIPAAEAANAALYADQLFIPVFDQVLGQVYRREIR